MNICLASTVGTAVSSKLDANKGSSKVEIKNKAQTKVAFNFHHSLYFFVRMLFGSRNESSKFQIMRNFMLSATNSHFIPGYFDYVEVFSRSAAKRIDHLKNTWKFLCHVKVILKLIEWNFFTETIDWLGHATYLRRVETLSHMMDACRGLKVLRNDFDLKCFLRRFAVFKRFAPIFARITFVLSDKLRKGQSFDFVLSKKELHAIDRFRRKFIFD